MVHNVERVHDVHSSVYSKENVDITPVLPQLVEVENDQSDGLQHEDQHVEVLSARPHEHVNVDDIDGEQSVGHEGMSHRLVFDDKCDPVGCEVDSDEPVSEPEVRVLLVGPELLFRHHQHSCE